MILLAFLSFLFFSFCFPLISATRGNDISYGSVHTCAAMTHEIRLPASDKIANIRICSDFMGSITFFPFLPSSSFVKFKVTESLLNIFNTDHRHDHRVLFYVISTPTTRKPENVSLIRSKRLPFYTLPTIYSIFPLFG